MNGCIDDCAVVGLEMDVNCWDHGGRTFAISRDLEGVAFATDGPGTHEKVHLADVLVTDHTIKCPKHNGRFDYRTGAPLRVLVCFALSTFTTCIEAGRIKARLV